MAQVTFDLVTDHFRQFMKHIPLVDGTLVDPTNAAYLEGGEWVTLASSGKAERASNVASTGNAATLRSWPVFLERGRTDLQAKSSRGVPVLWTGGEFEAWTLLFDAAVTVGSGAPITTILQPLKVATVDLTSTLGRKYTGLVGHGGAADSAPIVGYVTMLPANNSGKLQFITGGRRL